MFERKGSSPQDSSAGFAFSLPNDALEAIARRAAEIAVDVVRSEVGSSPWLTRREAAEYLRVPLSRLEKDKTVPCRRWDGRILYNRFEIDGWLEQHRA